MSRYHYHGRRYGKMRAFARGFGGVLNVFGGPLPPIPKRPRRSILDDAANLRRDGEQATALVLDWMDQNPACSPEEARRRIRVARQRLREIMIAEPEEHDQGATNMDAFRAGFHLPDRL